MSEVQIVISDYPATLNIDYPNYQLISKFVIFFRILGVIPIAVIYLLITNGFITWGEQLSQWKLTFMTSGVLFWPVLLMIVCKKQYPKWWFDWNLAFTKFWLRILSFLALINDEFPSTYEDQSVHVNIEYPDVQTQLKRGMPLIKWFLATPHFVIICFLTIAAIVCVIIAWFAILFTAHYPRCLFNFVVGVIRWAFRLDAYAGLLVTDKYPPFSLSA
jgi:hypothetical protein